MQRVPVKPFLLFSLLPVPLINIFRNAGDKRAGARAEVGARRSGLSLLFLTAILVAGLTATPPAAVAQEYEIINLDPSQTVDTYAYGLNDGGQVVGERKPSEGPIAFLWTKEGGMVDLKSLSSKDSYASAINSEGRVVGQRLTDNGYQAFLWAMEDGQEEIVDLGVALGSLESVAYAINALDQVVGSYIPSVSDGSGVTQAFLWTAEREKEDLDFPGNYSIAYAINSKGQVVGIRTNKDGKDNAFLWPEEGCTPTNPGDCMVDLSFLPNGSRSQANAINDEGQVVGWSETLNKETQEIEIHAFLWTKAGGMVDLGTFGGDYSEALAINSKGQVVGISTKADYVKRAFLWTEAIGMVDLDILPGGSFSEAYAINDNGQIAGASEIAPEQWRAVLWQVVTAKDQQGPVVEDVDVTPNPSPVNGPIVLKAVVDDTNTGNSNILSVEYSLDKENWIPIEGTFDSPVVTVVAELNAPAEPGIYKLYVRGTDIYGNVGKKECSLLAVYKPGCGFLTGGGWFHSHPGAFRRNLKLWGKAVFGFVAKHEKWDTQEDHRPEFQFKVGDLNFRSANYDWLVADEGGLGAQLKGLGRINGIGNYHFMLWANDGTSEGFRVRIWHEDAVGKETVVYDNDEDQAIEKGKIILSNQ
jgi:probable HAF family extracellular repeat protein